MMFSAYNNINPMYSTNSISRVYPNPQCFIQDLTDDDINYTLRNLEGDALPGFPSPDTFEMLISPHLSKILQPSEDLMGREGKVLML